MKNKKNNQKHNIQLTKQTTVNIILDARTSSSDRRQWAGRTRTSTTSSSSFSSDVVGSQLVGMFLRWTHRQRERFNKPCFQPTPTTHFTVGGGGYNVFKQKKFRLFDVIVPATSILEYWTCDLGQGAGHAEVGTEKYLKWGQKATGMSTDLAHHVRQSCCQK